MATGILATGLLAVPARAGNQEAVFLGNQAAMSGGAVVAWVNDGGAPWYNPAGLATIEGTSVDLSASAFVLRHYLLPGAAQTRLSQGLLQKDASFTEVVSVPAALTVMRRLSDHVAGGLAVFVPYQEDILVSAAYDQKGSQADYAWSFSASRRAARYYAGPAIAVSLSPRLQLGLSLFGTYESRLTARDFTSSLDARDGPVRQAVLTLDQKLDQKLFGTTLALGFRWDIDDDWSTGIVIRPPLFHLAGKAKVDFAATSAVVAADGEAQVDAQRAALDQEPALFDRMEPARMEAGVSRALAGGRLSAQVSWQSSANGGGVIRRPGLNGRVGGAFPVSPRFALGAGFFTDRSPNVTPTSLGETKVDFYGGSFGVRYSTAHRVTDDEEERKGLVFSTTVALRYALGLGEIGGLSFSPLSPPAFFVADVTIHELSLHIGSALDF
ncbi:MAG: hypothetical protein R3B72_12100 [Polyangiaceae bacterium]